MKKITLIFLSFVIYFNSITLANAAVGGWTMSNPVAQGASSVYTGTKNIIINGADYVKKGTAIVTPTATGVAKVLARGAGGYALSVAVEQLLGSVDWVLDPANNQIRYTQPLDPNQRYVYRFQGVNYTGPDAVCNAYFALHAQTSIKLENKKVTINNNGASVVCTASQTYSCGGGTRECKDSLTYQVNRTAIIDGPTEEEKTLPLPVVAEKVISNAAAGDAAAQVATTAAAADIVAEAETDQTGVKARPIAQQLESSSTTKPSDEAAAEKANEATGEQTKNPDKPDTTDLKLEFPIFCNWAPTVCEAAQTVISFPKTLTNWWEIGKEKAESWANSISESWTEAKEWASSETKPEEKDTEVDTIQEPLPNIDTGIFQASGQCPPDFSYPFPLPMGGTYTVTYSYATACYWFSKLYYIVVSVAWVIAFRIVTNTNTGNSENG